VGPQWQGLDEAKRLIQNLGPEPWLLLPSPPHTPLLLVLHVPVRCIALPDMAGAIFSFISWADTHSDVGVAATASIDSGGAVFELLN
jgi:hypothetical protein